MTRGRGGERRGRRRCRRRRRRRWHAAQRRRRCRHDLGLSKQRLYGHRRSRSRGGGRAAGSEHVTATCKRKLSCLFFAAVGTAQGKRVFFFRQSERGSSAKKNQATFQSSSLFSLLSSLFALPSFKRGREYLCAFSAAASPPLPLSLSRARSVRVPHDAPRLLKAEVEKEKKSSISLFSKKRFSSSGKHSQSEPPFPPFSLPCFPNPRS